MSNVLLFAQNFHNPTKQVILINFNDFFSVWWGFHAVIVGYLKSRPRQFKLDALLFSPGCKCSPLYILIASMHFAETRTVCHKAPSACFLTLVILPITKRKMTETMTKCLNSRLVSVCRSTRVILFCCCDYVTAKCPRANNNMSAVSLLSGCSKILILIPFNKGGWWGGLSSLQFSSQYTTLGDETNWH